MDYFSIQLGMSSSQLTFTPSFFRGVGQPPTSSGLSHTQMGCNLASLLLGFLTPGRSDAESWQTTLQQQPGERCSPIERQ